MPRCLSWRTFLAEFYLTSQEKKNFVTSQWKSDDSKWKLVYLCYRIILALFFIGILIYSVFDMESHRFHWFIYLTNWGIVILTANFILSAVLVACHVKKKIDADDQEIGDKLQVLKYYDIPLSYKISWILSNSSTTVAFGITVGYWSAVYNPQTTSIDAVNCLTHLTNSIAAFIDLFIVARPWKLAHFIQPLLYVISYLFFNIIYWAFGGTNIDGERYIYSILNWDHVASTMICVTLGFIIVPVVHALCVGMYQIRVFIHKKITANKSDLDVNNHFGNNGLVDLSTIDINIICEDEK